MTEIASRTPMQELVAAVRGDQFKAEIANALPGNLAVERFVRVALTAINRTPELVTAEQGTVFTAIIRCAQDGLLPDGREAAIVVVNDKNSKTGKAAAYWPMIGGYRKIAAKHGMVLAADVVRANDHFEWSKVPPRIEHSYKLGDDRGDIIGAYSAAFWNDSGRIVGPPTVMDVDEIEKVRAVSKAAQSQYGPWMKWWDRQACKTVGRRQFKELPIGDLDERAASIIAAADDDADLPNPEPSMTVDEANVDATIGAAAPQPSGGPDDTLDEAEDAHFEPVDPEPEADAGEQQAAFPIPRQARGTQR